MTWKAIYRQATGELVSIGTETGTPAELKAAGLACYECEEQPAALLWNPETQSFTAIDQIMMRGKVVRATPSGMSLVDDSGLSGVVGESEVPAPKKRRRR